jgi:hypothetical protein
LKDNYQQREKKSMLKKVVIAITLFSSALLALPQAANAELVCHRSWHHGHPVRHCWHVHHHHHYHRR